MVEGVSCATASGATDSMVAVTKSAIFFTDTSYVQLVNIVHIYGDLSIVGGGFSCVMGYLGLGHTIAILWSQVTNSSLYNCFGGHR